MIHRKIIGRLLIQALAPKRRCVGGSLLAPGRRQGMTLRAVPVLAVLLVLCAGAHAQKAGSSGAP